MSAVNSSITPFIKKKKVLQKAWGQFLKSGQDIAVATAKSTAVHWGKRFVGDAVEAVGEIVDEDMSEASKVVEGTSAVEIEKVFNRQGDELLGK